MPSWASSTQPSLRSSSWNLALTNTTTYVWTNSPPARSLLSRTRARARPFYPAPRRPPPHTYMLSSPLPPPPPFQLIKPVRREAARAFEQEGMLRIQQGNHQKLEQEVASLTVRRRPACRRAAWAALEPLLSFCAWLLLSSIYLTQGKTGAATRDPFGAGACQLFFRRRHCRGRGRRQQASGHAPRA